MGLKNNDSKGIKYVKIKDGKFYLSSDKENATPFTELEGTLTRISFKDETFNDQKIRKANFSLTDAEEGTTYIVGMSVNSSYFSSLISFLKNADLSKPITLYPKMQVDKENPKKSSRKIFVSQEGTYMKAYFTKEHPNGLPEFEKVKFKGQITYDTTKFIEFLEGVVIQELIPQLPKGNLVTFTKEKAVEEDFNTEELDDVPDFAAVGKKVKEESGDDFPWDK